VTNYRSLKNATIELGRLTVVTGPNGSGKSNFYRALELVQAAAIGKFANALLEEGGMPSALWAGRRGKGPVRMGLTTQWDDLSHDLQAGLVPIVPADPPDPFVLDPEVKEEYVYLGRARKPTTTLAERRGSHAKTATVDGDLRRTLSLRRSESLLSQLGEPALYPELDELQRRIRGWRFYHQFDTGPTSPIRSPQPGVTTDALASSGTDLAAAIATLIFRGDRRALDDAVEQAFPGYRVLVSGDPGIFGVGLQTKSLLRPLTAQEFSDGQLRFLCLATALLSTRPPELLVLNEPETSLHPSAVVALAPLIKMAAQFSQVWVTTHDESLRDALADQATISTLELRSGSTHVTLYDETHL